jgi:hypothetical protein
MSNIRSIVQTTSDEIQQKVWNKAENVYIFAPETKKSKKFN